jgi:ribosomal-protein-alanine N-acetyltransferase
VTIRLRQLAASSDPAALAEELASCFGGDPQPARELIEQTLGLLTRNPRPQQWGCYLASVGEDTVGTCAFKAAPDDKGLVEIAYMTFPAFEGRGHATAMAGKLVEVARSGGASMAIAHTLAEENASTRALRRNHFVHTGEVNDPEDGLVWRWERSL